MVIFYTETDFTHKELQFLGHSLVYELNIDPRTKSTILFNYASHQHTLLELISSSQNYLQQLACTVSPSTSRE